RDRADPTPLAPDRRPLGRRDHLRHPRHPGCLPGRAVSVSLEPPTHQGMRRALGVVVIGVIAACATAAPSSTDPPPSTPATVGVLEPRTTVAAPYPSTSSIVSTTATTTT